MQSNTAAQRPTYLEIDLQAIIANARHIREITGACRQMAVVKGNAYAHGMQPVAQALAPHVDYFGVTFPEEGIALREAGIQKPILMFSAVPPRAAEAIVHHHLAQTVTDLATARALSNAAIRQKTPAVIHLKIDTGMGRLGVLPDDAPAFAAAVKALPGLNVEGIYSHLPAYWPDDQDYTQRQIAVFMEVLARLGAQNISFPLRHLASSSATLHLPESRLDMVRSGSNLYALISEPRTDFQRALALKSAVTFVKKVPAGSRVGYGLTYTARPDSRIAVIPIGSADGYPRALSNRAEVLIRGRRFPVAGVICMDQTLIDVGASDVAMGDEVVLIGRQGNDEIKPLELSRKIPDGSLVEFVARLAARIPRRYV